MNYNGHNILPNIWTLEGFTLAYGRIIVPMKNNITKSGICIDDLDHYETLLYEVYCRSPRFRDIFDEFLKYVDDIDLSSLFYIVRNGDIYACFLHTRT